MLFPSAIQNLITQLAKLPEIGPKAAFRLVFYLINQEQKELDELSALIKNLKTSFRLCPQCFNLAGNSQSFCSICQDPKRDKSVICAVEDILDIIPIEKTRQYSGLYHVLGGLISPADGLGPEQLKIKELVGRIKLANSEQRTANNIKEVILALNPTTEGDTTALYLERLLKPLNIKITRLGRGLSQGADLEYADENTLTNALLGRR
ncbi:MAG: recombination protein RecR [Candidatus Portnoybacteria bacterium RIFCSPLOWO2_12_FULL_39_9]|uniref:Recombination protein RecR n=1 Tax=Candidatus Portnoybacteria bacterium RIFCSPHIGHO2_12_FULL_38_9 TaxID=1801997 RepID=A0A1G2FGB5_9BACT|nr:MAG: recombination protein RecR [Candidatus Portnoybacteria bacterium RBG_13_40_8]OGZ35982.1 MAG: recombination protein RecR [Candidatus Portnoybacteria bacterium RIFCSPHIGHO2_02_FULL_39_12]OGZ36648.1 MAG: recombination protein RecR [Candidatus Portnoybacteria bacterium RIFCSPHIGHO2_12_FULL_38_9]OGZ39530.1 MAG: recombination protein RecR [Candidatus Portnoybacteria bacterium RIFCSPLOWO2_01_FULL_38_39]OGZ40012.1 MAG: recombination protein RecR [Candidatus Portnoybacteria bacterium RIFCSPLOWO2